VFQLLEALSNEKSISIALVTGNLSRGAKIKLAYHGLDRFFATGGFAEDGATREEVILQGMYKAQQTY
jgi:phosphoglycolate phosphatase